MIMDETAKNFTLENIDRTCLKVDYQIPMWIS